MPRKCKCTPSIITQVKEWVSINGLTEYDGAKISQLLQFLYIEEHTYYKWLNTIPEFKEAIEQGKEQYRQNRASRLVKALFKASEGGYIEEETETTEYVPSRQRRNNQTDQNEQDSQEEQSRPTIRKMVKTKTKRYFKPDVKAATFLLKNLDPEHYKERQETDVMIKGEDKQEKTLEEINAEIARLQQLD